MVKTIRTVPVIWVGNMFLAFSIAAFLEPTGIISGGTAGIGLFMQAYFHLPISATLAVVNVICFLLGLFVLGRQFAATTLLSTVISPFILRFFEGIPALSTLTDDLLLSAVMAGVLAGVGVGLVMRAGASTGGMDIPPLVLRKITGIPVGTVMLTLNGVTLLLQIPHSNPEQILYGIITAFLTSASLDQILMIGSKQSQLLIISPHYNIIREALLHSDVGLTLFPIETGLNGDISKAILCAVPTRKLMRIKEIVVQIDTTSFILVTSTAEISGRGFTLPR
ncbi:YitT family protein [Oscillospiraceae bacterium 44-5]